MSTSKASRLPKSVLEGKGRSENKNSVWEADTKVKVSRRENQKTYEGGNRSLTMSPMFVCKQRKTKKGQGERDVPTLTKEGQPYGGVPGDCLSRDPIKSRPPHENPFPIKMLQSAGLWGGRSKARCFRKQRDGKVSERRESREGGGTWVPNSKRRKPKNRLPEGEVDLFSDLWCERGRSFKSGTGK